MDADRRAAESIAARLRVGGVALNDALLTFATVAAPFGGWGASGFGRAHGFDGLREFLGTTAVVRNRWPGWADFHWFPYGRHEGTLRRLLCWFHGG